jgi:hypothetical protein
LFRKSFFGVAVIAALKADVTLHSCNVGKQKIVGAIDGS